ENLHPCRNRRGASSRRQSVMLVVISRNVVFACVTMALSTCAAAETLMRDSNFGGKVFSPLIWQVTTSDHREAPELSEVQKSLNEQRPALQRIEAPPASAEPPANRSQRAEAARRAPSAATADTLAGLRHSRERLAQMVFRRSRQPDT